MSNNSLIKIFPIDNESKEMYGLLKRIDEDGIAFYTIFHSYMQGDQEYSIPKQYIEIFDEMYKGWNSDLKEIDSKLDEVFGTINPHYEEQLQHAIDVYWDNITAAGWSPTILQQKFDAGDYDFTDLYANLIFEYALERRGLDASLFMN
jgi:hypothetical protein